MLILGMALDWSSFGGVSGDGPFDYFFTGGIAWILVVAVGVLAFLHAGGKLPDTQPWSLIFLGATGLAAILMILRILIGGHDVGGGSRSTAVPECMPPSSGPASHWPAAVMNFTASGGNFNDLKDMDKLKGSFSGRRAATTCRRPRSSGAPRGLISVG